MKGSIHYHKKAKRYYVEWYEKGGPGEKGKSYKIYKYKGEYIYSPKVAEKLRSAMQSDVESGTFLIDRYTKGDTDVVPYLRKWLQAISKTISPATLKDYNNSIENHLAPFFRDNPVMLSEIQYDTLMMLLNSINRTGKGKLNVMYCLRACLDYAWKSRRIPAIPPFPERKKYDIVEQPIQWLTSDRQEAVIRAIPLEHQPIFWFLKYHVRRPSEAMAILKEDMQFDVITIRRGISNQIPIERTKTGKITEVPLCNEFLPYLEIEADKQKKYGIISPYLFVHPHGKHEGRRYTHKTLTMLWNEACAITGETIGLYKGTKHSTCSQLVNEYGYSVHEVQVATDHARLESVKKYAKVELATRKAIFDRKRIIPLGEKLARKSGNGDK